MTDVTGPTLFCFDGSDGSRAALAAAADRLRPGPAVVLTVWETIALRVATGAFSGGMTVANLDFRCVLSTLFVGGQAGGKL